MELLKQKLDEIFKASGLDVSVDIDAEGKRVNIFITNEGIVEQFMPRLLSDIDHIVRLIAKNLQLDRVYVDVNNYKKEKAYGCESGIEERFDRVPCNRRDRYKFQSGSEEGFR